jgi:hypothetical protein
VEKLWHHLNFVHQTQVAHFRHISAQVLEVVESAGPSHNVREPVAEVVQTLPKTSKIRQLKPHGKHISYRDLIETWYLLGHFRAVVGEQHACLVTVIMQESQTYIQHRSELMLLDLSTQLHDDIACNSCYCLLWLTWVTIPTSRKIRRGPLGCSCTRIFPVYTPDQYHTPQDLSDHMLREKAKNNDMGHGAACDYLGEDRRARNCERTPSPAASWRRDSPARA